MDYDANPIHVFTPYSYEQMKAFQRFHYRKMRRNTLIMLCFIMPALVFNLVISFLLNFNWRELLPVYWGGIIFWLIVLFLPFLVFNGTFYTRKAHANAVKLMQNGQSYSFCNNDFAHGAEQQDNVWQGRTAYSAILNVWETRDMFYLYTGKLQAHLVDKGGFGTGSPDEFRALLQAHVPSNKYKKYKV